MHHPTDRIKHSTAFVTPVVEHWLERSHLSCTSRQRQCNKQLTNICHTFSLAPSNEQNLKKKKETKSTTKFNKMCGIHSNSFLEHSDWVFSFYNYKNTKPNERKEMFYLTTHSTHFIYGYMASDIW